MKKVFLISALSLATMFSTAHAADTALLKVTGKLTNAACSPTLTKGGVADYGHIFLGDLSPSAVNQLGHQNITLNISCPSATKVAWTLADNHGDTLPSPSVSVKNADAKGGSAFSSSSTAGLGKTAGDVNIGAWALYVEPTGVKADGVSADLLEEVGEMTWTKSTTGSVQMGNGQGMTVASTGTTTPVSITSAEFPLVVSAAIQDTTTLAITDDTNLDGEATITLKYL